jgi:hypothetical protein
VSFKNHIAADISTFIDADEFADSVMIDGISLSVVIDAERLKERAATEYGGVTTGMILYFIPVSAFSSRPSVGSSQRFKNRMMYIEDVREDNGVYEVILNQNRSE